MNAYERGFHDGEHKAFEDRKAGKPRRIRPDGDFGDYGRGYWDGYTPRSMLWALNKTPIKAYTEAETTV